MQLLGEARLDDVHRGGEHRADAEADERQAGNECPDAVRAPDEREQEHDPGDGDDEACDDQRLLREPLGESLGGEGGGEDAERRCGEDDARLDRAVAANLLQVDGDDERRPQEHQPLDVLRDEREVARPVLEQPRGEQCLLSGPLAGADEEEERQHEGRSDHQEDRHQGVVGAGLKDPDDDAEHADRRQDRPDRVERTGRVGLERIFEAAAQQDDHRDDDGLEDERGAPADRRGDQASDQRPCRCADAAEPADHAEGPGARGEVGEPQGREDVYRRDQERCADALEHRVAEDQHPEVRRDRADQGSGAVEHQAPGEAPLAAPALGQLAARNHQDGHDHQEQRDRGLHALDGRVQVLADVR